MKFTVIYEQGPTSWGAYVPDLPGVISVADSRDEVAQLIQEAIEFHLQALRDDGLSIPKPSSFAGVVEIEWAACQAGRGNPLNSRPARKEPATRSPALHKHTELTVRLLPLTLRCVTMNSQSCPCFVAFC
jgi:predicted RNase H-like HicB family nuclease